MTQWQMLSVVKHFLSPLLYRWSALISVCQPLNDSLYQEAKGNRLFGPQRSINCCFHTLTCSVCSDHESIDAISTDINPHVLNIECGLEVIGSALKF